MTDEDRIEKIFAAFASNNPDPKTELEYTNPFTLVVAVALSAQTTDIAVNKATKDLFQLADNPRKMLELGIDGLKTHIKSLNFFHTKARNIISLSEILLKDYKGDVPLEFEKLIQLPGVGRKTANVVLNCLLGDKVMPVDTHVFRVSRRLGFAKGETVEKVEQELLANIPDKWLKNAHHWLILHGRYICKARKPECDKCIIAAECCYNLKSLLNLQ